MFHLNIRTFLYMYQKKTNLKRLLKYCLNYIKPCVKFMSSVLRSVHFWNKKRSILVIKRSLVTHLPLKGIAWKMFYHSHTPMVCKSLYMNYTNKHCCIVRPFCPLYGVYLRHHTNSKSMCTGPYILVIKYCFLKIKEYIRFGISITPMWVLRGMRLLIKNKFSHRTSYLLSLLDITLIIYDIALLL